MTPLLGSLLPSDFININGHDPDKNFFLLPSNPSTLRSVSSMARPLRCEKRTGFYQFHVSDLPSSLYLLR
jgi:hypothetical protein